MSQRQARSRISRRPQALAALAAVALAVGLMPAAASAGAATSFPVPTCGWASARLVSGYLHVSLRSPKSSWATKIAPVLSCAYTERRASRQKAGHALVTISFRELQYFKRIPTSWVAVRGVGSCLSRISCTTPGHPAYAFVRHGQTGKSPYYVMPFVSGVALEAEDGLNCVTITIDNPRGPLPVRDELAQAKALVKRLLPRFYWH